MRSIRMQIAAIIILAILTSILSVFVASFLIIQSETNQNSVGMMNLIDQDTQKSLEKYFESIEQSVEIAANIAIEDLDSVLLVECGAIRTGPEQGVQTRISEFGATEDVLDELTDMVVSVSFGPDGKLNGHPKMTREDIYNCFKLSL